MVRLCCFSPPTLTTGEARWSALALEMLVDTMCFISLCSLSNAEIMKWHGELESVPTCILELYNEHIYVETCARSCVSDK